MAQRADVTVLCLGLSAEIEGEQGDVSNSEAAGDKTSLELPGLQQTLLEEVVALGKPTVLVLLAGSALSINWADEHVRAIVQAWYPGQATGQALADILFGDHSPAGRLPITFPRSLADVPEFTDYRMKGRTYRYAEKEPLYPFGYGLSYTRFEYDGLTVDKAKVSLGDEVVVSAEVKNVGERAGDEVVQLYVKALDAPFVVPVHELRGFSRLAFEPGQARRVSFTLSSRDLSLIDEAGQRVFQPGRYRLFVGGSQPDERSGDLIGEDPSSLDIELVGAPAVLDY
jgi:beta-glucosidase